MGRGEERMAAARQLAKAAVINHHQQYVGRTISMASWRAAAVAIVDDQAPAAERSHHHMAPNCRIDIPANTESTDVGATSSPDLFLLRHSVRDRDQGHPFLFAPKEQRADGWLPVMRAAQNPQSCSRYLLVADDMKQAGLGYTGRMLASTLLLAIRQRRVLHEVPLTNQTTGIQYGRWCHQPPYTLQCAFEPWSSCPLPASALAVSFEATCQLPTKVRNISGRAVNSRPAFDHMCLFKMNAPVVRIQLTSIYSMTALYQKPGDGAFGVLRAAHRFLYVPRPWVRTLARCVKRQHGLHAGRFLSVHIRLSPQKAKESSRAGKRMPTVSAYTKLAQLTINATGLRHVFLQTANPQAVVEFAAWAVAANVSLSYTDNPRQKDDSWGGWTADQTNVQTAVAAVNALVASQAALIISPSSGVSVWTSFLTHLFGYDARLGSRAAPRVSGGMDGHGNTMPQYLSSGLGELSISCGGFRTTSKLRVISNRGVLPLDTERHMWNHATSHGCIGSAAIF